jgi:hypothetical protein
MHKQPTFSAVQPSRLEKFAYSISLSASIATCNILCTLLPCWFRLQKEKDISSNSKAVQILCARHCSWRCTVRTKNMNLLQQLDVRRVLGQLGS